MWVKKKNHNVLQRKVMERDYVFYRYKYNHKLLSVKERNNVWSVLGHVRCGKTDKLHHQPHSDKNKEETGSSFWVKEHHWAPAQPRGKSNLSMHRFRIWKHLISPRNLQGLQAQVIQVISDFPSQVRRDSFNLYERKTSQKTKDKNWIRDRIKSFPTVESHYCRRETQPGRTLREIWM